MTLISKHVLNSIHKSCELQKLIIDSNVLNWATVTNTYSLICQMLFPPPDEHNYAHNDNFATRNGKLWKVIADIAQRDGNEFVLFLFHEH